MAYRRFAIRASAFLAFAAIAIFAVTSGGSASKADAAGVAPSCTFATPIPQLILQGGGPDTVTCTFTIHSVAHTLVVDFTVAPAATPPLSITSCTLDSSPIHVGPCP